MNTQMKLIAAGVGLGGLMLTGGCAQITVTAETVVDGTARVADATTNAVESTFNVTTDTTRDVDARTHQARLAFVQSELEMLKREAASGDGERLRALAYMMQAEDSEAFGRMMQQNYSTLFSANSELKPAPETMLQSLYKVAGTPPDMQQS